MNNLFSLFLALLLAFPLPALAQTGRSGTTTTAVTETVVPVGLPGTQAGSVAPANIAPSLALPTSLPTTKTPVAQTETKAAATFTPAPASALPAPTAVPQGNAPAGSAPVHTPAPQLGAASQVLPPVQVDGAAAPDKVAGQGPKDAALSAESAAITAQEKADKRAGTKNAQDRIDRRIEELRRAFTPRAVEDAAGQGHSRNGVAGTDAAAKNAREESGRRAIEGAMGRFEAQISAMTAELGHAPILAGTILQAGREAFNKIRALILRSVVSPQRTLLRASAEDAPVKPEARTLRVGVYPVAADPFQWAHLIIGLRAIAELKLDKVVFILQGDDTRKPNMTEAAFRHPMGRAVLEQFSPLFQYSSIGVGNTFDGETNIFRILELNPEQKIDAFYIVGGDHYRFTTESGSDDTLNKIAKKLADPKLIDRSKHSVSLAFVERDVPLKRLQTPLDVHFLKDVGFEASSTQVRKGNYELMPWAAYEYVKKHRPGLYGIGAPN
ncbi:MAG: hypothetical protein WC969_07635 [Elusimicrobiota bacterium]|jgi:hypothetical protein